MNKPIYNVKFQYNGVNFEKDCYAYDYGVTYPGCYTFYFKDNAKIIVDADGVTDFEVTLIK